jgi:tRNA(fMet)-specific endonuclease VapC
MGILIDSSVFIAYERGALNLGRLLGLEDEPVAISAVTVSELLHGVYRAEDTRRRERRQRFVEGILSRFPVVGFGLETARVHARLWADLASRGEIIGAHDLLIAATAIAIGFDLVTADARSFRRIPGLRVHVW